MIKSAIWYECKIRYEKMMENGMQKKVTEQYVVDAVSFTEAEARITEQMKDFISGDFDVRAVKIANYTEVMISDADVDDRWYKVKANLITLSERSGKEKRTGIRYLVNAANVETARKTVSEYFASSLESWEIESVSETKFLDVFAL
jgi:hypothetical protein